MVIHDRHCAACGAFQVCRTSHDIIFSLRKMKLRESKLHDVARHILNSAASASGHGPQPKPGMHRPQDY